jgi:hypothetical protein
MSGCTKRQAWLNISRGSHSLFVFTLLVFLKASTLPQKLRQFRHVGRNPPSLVLREQLGERAPAGLPRNKCKRASGRYGRSLQSRRIKARMGISSSIVAQTGLRASALSVCFDGRIGSLTRRPV